MALTYFAAAHGDNGSAASNPATAVWPDGIVAGDLLLVSFGISAVAGTSVPAGFTLVTTTGTTNCGVKAFWKIADGTESGTTFSFGLSGSYHWSVQLSCFHTTGYVDATSFSGASGAFTTTDDDQYTAPDPGAVTTGNLGWTAGFAYSGSPGTRSVTGTGWTIAGGWNWGPAFPNQMSMITAYKSPSAAGAPTHRYGTANDFDTLAGISFIIADFPLPAQPGLFFGNNF